MAKNPKVEVVQDEPGAEERFMRGIKKAVNTPPKPFTPPAKGAARKIGTKKGK